MNAYIPFEIKQCLNPGCTRRPPTLCRPGSRQCGSQNPPGLEGMAGLEGWGGGGGGRPIGGRKEGEGRCWGGGDGGRGGGFARNLSPRLSHATWQTPARWAMWCIELLASCAPSTAWLGSSVTRHSAARVLDARTHSSSRWLATRWTRLLTFWTLYSIIFHSFHSLSRAYLYNKALVCACSLWVQKKKKNERTKIPTQKMGMNNFKKVE